MIKTYKFRLYPTKKQTDKLDSTLDLCRILYNSCLADRNRRYKETGKGLSRIDQQKILVQDKKNINYLTGIHSQVLQDVLFRVEKAYKAFFRRLKDKSGKAGYPRFKSLGRYDSITYTQSGFSIIDGKLKLSKIGTIKLKQHRNINGAIRTCNIKKETDKWYVCFSVEYTGKDKNTVIKTHTGIDMGVKSFAVLSDGKVIDNPKYLVKSEEKLVKKQRQLSKKKKGSNNRKKAVVKVAKVHCRIKNQRKDFQHKKSRELVDSCDAIGAEDLKIRNMVKNHNLAKSISDGGWGQFLSYLEYKAEEAGKLFMKVNPRNTSKECHICGYVYPDMTLDIREWTCPICNTHHDRDVNAACIVDKRMLEKIRQELPEYTLGETGSMDDIVGSDAYALKSIPSLNQEASSVRAR
jgi:putative transposase